MTNKMVKTLTLIVAVVALTSAFALAEDLQTAAKQNLTGTVTCEGRINHRYTCQRNQTQQTCTLDCVQQGSRFALVVGDKVYLLEGDNHELETYAGGKATVTGVGVNDRAIEVETASSARHSMPNRNDAQPSSMGADTQDAK
jgi:hypothetical protein